MSYYYYQQGSGRHAPPEAWSLGVAKYRKDIAEIGQCGHNHGLGLCKTFEIPQSNTSTTEKDGKKMTDKQECTWCEDIW